MSSPKIGGPTYERAILLTQLAFDMCRRQGQIIEMKERGIYREYKGNGFSVSYSDPEECLTDEHHHLDVHVAERGKVLSVAWKDSELAEVVSFKRGSWEDYLLS